MHGAAVMLGYSELLLPKSIQFFNQARVLFLQLEQILEYCKAIQVFQSLINDVLSSSQPLIADEIF
jgi:hypothetical protein